MKKGTLEAIGAAIDDAVKKLGSMPVRVFLEAAVLELGGVKDVHTEHCCAKHGCKYGDPHCTVTTGMKRQSGPCEYCGKPPVYDDEMSRRTWVGPMEGVVQMCERCHVRTYDAIQFGQYLCDICIPIVRGERERHARSP